jgi:hypothetical protein
MCAYLAEVKRVGHGGAERQAEPALRSQYSTSVRREAMHLVEKGHTYNSKYIIRLFIWGLFWQYRGNHNPTDLQYGKTVTLLF